MTINEIIKRNKSIAFFDGWTFDNSFPDKNRVLRKGNQIELDTTLKYNTSWEWLMPICTTITHYFKHRDNTLRLKSILMNGTTYSHSAWLNRVFEEVSNLTLQWCKENKKEVD